MPVRCPGASWPPSPDGRHANGVAACRVFMIRWDPSHCSSLHYPVPVLSLCAVSHYRNLECVTVSLLTVVAEKRWRAATNTWRRIIPDMEYLGIIGLAARRFSQ